MINQIINYIKAWLRGDDAELDIEFKVIITWLDILFLFTFIALFIWLWR